MARSRLIESHRDPTFEVNKFFIIWLLHVALFLQAHNQSMDLTGEKDPTIGQ